MIDFIKDIQDCLFAVKDSEIYKSYYMNHVYEMDCEIHNLLKFILGEKNIRIKLQIINIIVVFRT